jgi:hypothetical protein
VKIPIVINRLGVPISFTRATLWSTLPIQWPENLERAYVEKFKMFEFNLQITAFRFLKEWNKTGQKSKF